MTTFPSMADSNRLKLTTWIPAMFAVLVICVESQNGMGSARTGLWLAEFMRWTGHQDTFVETLNHVLRKSGHFTGYGLLGLCFARGWMAVLRGHIHTTWSGLRLRAGACGVASAFVVASCDEFHQIFLPTRGASIWDVLLDTTGAVTLALLLLAYLALRRGMLIQPVASPLTTLGLSRIRPRHLTCNGSVNRQRQSAGRHVGAVRESMLPTTLA